MTTKKKTASNPVGGLSSFEGRDVLQSTIKVTNAGDGLSDAMAVEPVEMHLGDTVYLLIEAEVSKINYEELKDTGCLRRVHTLRSGTATLVPDTFAVDAIDAQRVKLEQARGITRLEFDADDDE